MKRVRAAALRETVATLSLFHSRGFAATRRESLCTAHVETVAEENGEGQTGYGFGVARSLRGLNAAAIADEGATRALRMLGAVRPKTGEYRVVLENGAAAELLEVLIPSFLSSQVAKGKSMFAGKVGRVVASEAVTIEDDPLDPGGSGAEPFDAEGTPTRRRELIAKGELRGFLADAFWGRKIGTGSTGACRRPGPKAPPTVGISNLRISPGGHPPSALFEAAGDGILLTEFLGIHTADPVSGDFSVGASGIRIAGGALAEPLHGFAEADLGNHSRTTRFKHMTEASFQGVEGVKIFTREWQPAGEPRGVVVISHGLNAHSGLYEWAAQQFTSNGLAVYALDHRGRGR